MARVQIILDIEEADLRLLTHEEGIKLPTRVIRLRRIRLDGETVYQLQHSTTKAAEYHALDYRKDPKGDYPATEVGYFTR